MHLHAHSVCVVPVLFSTRMREDEAGAAAEPAGANPALHAAHSKGTKSRRGAATRSVRVHSRCAGDTTLSGLIHCTVVLRRMHRNIASRTTSRHCHTLQCPRQRRAWQQQRSAWPPVAWLRGRWLIVHTATATRARQPRHHCPDNSTATLTRVLWHDSRAVC